ncbi:uncharacterized protein LOC108155905 [Drosophila miranda]|uniref:uncharacterized protein LOC108155905 n=1 Tax=Drosophila miranda TaxID=7229 RepID=UPI0007E775E1|nr:uncharacterized protein LOC108155905 [Drosophila miranda]
MKKSIEFYSMSVPNTKQQLREILKAASVGPQPSDMGSVSPDDEPSTSGLAQQEKDVVGLQSKVVNAVETKQAIESPVPQRQSSADGNICLDLPEGWNCWTQGNNNDAVYAASPVVPVDRVFPMVPTRRESICKSFFCSLYDWMKRIAAGFGLAPPQESVSGWYKHCWDSLGSDLDLDLPPSLELDGSPKPIASSSPMREGNSNIAPYQSTQHTFRIQIGLN